MKKTFLTVMILLCGMTSLCAQDTIYRRSPLDCYFFPFWFDTSTEDNINWGWLGGSILREPEEFFGQGFHSDSTLTVYGIVAMLNNFRYNGFEDLPRYNIFDAVPDTNCDLCWESLQMYVYENSTMTQVGENLPVHVLHTPVNYYQNMKLMRGPWPSPLFPVYERYFEQPQTIGGDFFVGLTYHNFYEISPGVLSTWPMQIASFQDRDFEDLYVNRITELKYDDDGKLGWHFNEAQYPLLFVFPILCDGEHLPMGFDTITGSIDTTIVDTTGVDTTGTDGIRGVVERYVNVVPNPATERVQVTSSFGLRRVEVYNAAGIRVKEQEAAGYVATLDVGALPSGTYLVRIQTPAGTVTKKLAVRR